MSERMTNEEKMRRLALLRRHVRGAGACIEWTGYRRKDGYGSARVGGVNMLAHKAFYVLLVGAVRKGWSLDHLCRNRACVNVQHLEAVPHRINLLRGDTIAARHAAATHCPKGHEYTPENTAVRGGSRKCMECNRIRNRAYHINVRRDRRAALRLAGRL